jgi:hypothetical protein
VLCRGLRQVARENFYGVVALGIAVFYCIGIRQRNEAYRVWQM